MHSTFCCIRICWLSAFIKFCLYNSSLAFFAVIRDSTCSLNLAMSSASALFRLRSLKQFERTFVSLIETKSKRGIHRYSHLRRNWMDYTIHYSRSFIRIVGCHYDKEWIRMNERIYEELLETKLVYLVWNLCLKSLFEILTTFFHPDMKSHTRGCISFGIGVLLAMSAKQKLTNFDLLSIKINSLESRIYLPVLRFVF